jgi:ribosomal protein S18 acetylase RimI-like enzyme
MPGTSADFRPRKAAAGDLESIRSVVGLAYARYADRMDRPPEPVLQDYAKEVRAGTAWVIGDPILGVIVLVASDDSLLVQNVAVAPAAQGAGLGRLLLEFAEQQAARSGLPRLTLYTNEVMTENLAIYRRLGYREVDRRTQDGYRRIFMEKSLPAAPAIAPQLPS